MGKPQSTGNLVNALAQDSSNNIGIGGAANASFKLRVTGSSAGDSVYAIGDGASSGGALKIKQYASSAANEDGYSTISTLNTGVFYFTSASTSPNFKNFVLNPSGLTDNTLRTYTLPNASGTLALTSDLGSYLPLTGGTLTGALSGTSATFSGAVTLSSVAPTLNLTSTSASGINEIYFNRNTSTLIGYMAVGVNSTISGSGNEFIIDNRISGGNLIFRTNDAGTSAERMRIYSEGQIGIKGAATTEAAYALFTNDANTGFFNIFAGGSGTATKGIKLKVTSGSSTIDAMTITSGGNVGIGTSSPVSFGSTNTTLTLNNVNGGGGGGAFVCMSDGTQGLRMAVDSASSALWEPRNVDFRIATNNTERMRITSGGRLLVGQTSVSSASVNGACIFGDTIMTGSFAGVFWENRSGGVTSNSNWYGWYATSGTIYMFNGASNIASINTSSGAYTALSDINKKKDFEDSTIGLKAILGLKPTLYRMKSDETEGNKELGFIAQEVKEVIPQAYVETEDFIGLNYNAIVAALVKSVQEQQAQIEELKAIINK